MADLLPSTPDTSAAEEADPRVVGLADDDADELLSALSSETARELLAALHDDPAPPSELADAVDTSLQNAQYHLGNLQDAGLVEVVDTAYSSKGREMDVYAPSDRPLVVVAGDEDDGASLKAALSRFLGGLGVLSVASLVVEAVANGWFAVGGDDAGTPVAVEDEDELTRSAPGGGGGGDAEDEPAGGDGADGDEETAESEDAEPTADGAEEDSTDGGDDGGMDLQSEDEGDGDDGADDASATEEDAGDSTEDGADGGDGATDETAADGEGGSEDAETGDATEDGDAEYQSSPEAEGDSAVGDSGGDADVPIDGDLLIDGADEAVGLPPGFLFFLGGALSLTITFASWYWRAYR